MAVYDNVKRKKSEEKEKRRVRKGKKEQRERGGKGLDDKIIKPGQQRGTRLLALWLSIS